MCFFVLRRVLKLVPSLDRIGVSMHWKTRLLCAILVDVFRCRVNRFKEFWRAKKQRSWTQLKLLSLITIFDAVSVNEHTKARPLRLKFFTAKMKQFASRSLWINTLQAVGVLYNANVLEHCERDFLIYMKACRTYFTYYISSLVISNSRTVTFRNL